MRLARSDHRYGAPRGFRRLANVNPCNEQDGFETPCRDCGHRYDEHEPPECGRPGRCLPFDGSACGCRSFEFAAAAGRGR